MSSDSTLTLEAIGVTRDASSLAQRIADAKPLIDGAAGNAHGGAGLVAGLAVHLWSRVHD